MLHQTNITHAEAMTQPFKVGMHQYRFLTGQVGYAYLHVKTHQYQYQYLMRPLPWNNNPQHVFLEYGQTAVQAQG